MSMFPCGENGGFVKVPHVRPKYLPPYDHLEYYLGAILKGSSLNIGITKGIKLSNER